MYTVDRDDLHRAYGRWCEYYGHQRIYIKTLVESPYWETLIKAHYARQDNG